MDLDCDAVPGTLALSLSIRRMQRSPCYLALAPALESEKCISHWKHDPRTNHASGASPCTGQRARQVRARP